MSNHAAVGQVLFGDAAFLAVSLQILELRQSEFLARDIGEASSAVVLKRLIELEMIARVDHGNRRVIYERTDSPLWEVIEAARIALLNLKRGQTWQSGFLSETDPLFWHTARDLELKLARPLMGLSFNDHTFLMRLWLAARRSPYYDKHTFVDETGVYTDNSVPFYLEPLQELGMVHQVKRRGDDPSWSRTDSPLWLILERLAEVLPQLAPAVKPPKKGIVLPQPPPFEQLLRLGDWVPVSGQDGQTHYAALVKQEYQAYQLADGIVKPQSRSKTITGADNKTLCGQSAVARIDNLAEATCTKCLYDQNPYCRKVVDGQVKNFKSQTPLQIQRRLRYVEALLQRGAAHPVAVKDQYGWDITTLWRRLDKGQPILLYRGDRYAAVERCQGTNRHDQVYRCAMAAPKWRVVDSRLMLDEVYDYFYRR